MPVFAALKFREPASCVRRHEYVMKVRRISSYQFASIRISRINSDQFVSFLSVRISWYQSYQFVMNAGSASDAKENIMGPEEEDSRSVIIKW